MGTIMTFPESLNWGVAILHFSGKSFRGDPPMGKIMILPGGFSMGGSQFLILVANPFVETKLCMILPGVAISRFSSKSFRGNPP